MILLKTAMLWKLKGRRGYNMRADSKNIVLVKRVAEIGSYFIKMINGFFCVLLNADIIAEFNNYAEAFRFAKLHNAFFELK